MYKRPNDYASEVDVAFQEDNQEDNEEDWHIDAAAKRMGLSSGGFVANHLKAQFDATMQAYSIAKAAGSSPNPYNTQQYGQGFSAVREGDPQGFLGKCFAVARSVYQACEKIPVLNSPVLWNAVDHLVLRKSDDDITKNFLKALDGDKGAVAFLNKVEAQMQSHQIGKMVR